MSCSGLYCGAGRTVPLTPPPARDAPKGGDAGEAVIRGLDALPELDLRSSELLDGNADDDDDDGDLERGDML